MRFILFTCSTLLLIALLNLPIGFYTLLRITITISAIIVMVNELKRDINFWVIYFGLTAILFYPVIPIYLHDKVLWLPIDIITSIIFCIKAFTIKPNPKNNNT